MADCSTARRRMSTDYATLADLRLMGGFISGGHGRHRGGIVEGDAAVAGAVDEEVGEHGVGGDVYRGVRVAGPKLDLAEGNAELQHRSVPDILNVLDLRRELDNS